MRRPAARACRRRSPRACATRSPGCATATSTSCRAWGRPSRGPRPCSRSGARTLARGLARRGAEGARGHRARARGRGARGCLSRAVVTDAPLARWRAPAARRRRAGGPGRAARRPSRPGRGRRRRRARESFFALRVAMCSRRRGPAGVRRRVSTRCSARGWHDALDLIAAGGARDAAAHRRSRRAPGRPGPRPWRRSRSPRRGRRSSCCARRTSPRYSDREIARGASGRCGALARRGPRRLSRRARPVAPARRPRGPARDDPRVAALRRRAGRAALAPRHAAPAPGRARVRRVGLDGALRAHAAAPTCRRAWPRAAAWRRSRSAPG